MTNKQEAITLEDVLKFPCRFTIKVMGTNVPELVNEVVAIVDRHCEKFDPAVDIVTRPSSKGNYISLNVTVNAHSKKQLDEIYLALNNHQLVKITL